MSTKKCSAELYLTNNTGGNAFIQLSHKNAGLEPEIGCWQATPNETVGPLTVNFLADTDSDSPDYWYCSVTVQDGDNSGIYTTGGRLINPSRQFTLSESLDGKNLPCTIDQNDLDIIVNQEGDAAASFNLARLADYAEVTNVFVFMLENHSFDHIFGFSGLTGTDPVTGQATTVNGLSGDESNTYGQYTFTVHKGATDPMPIGPGHEFMDTMTQLCGNGIKNPFPKGPYPAIDSAGFVASYADEGATKPTEAQDVMNCCYSEKQVPILWNLAKEFAVCDNWFSSMPGPTWPNRLFAMGGSSAGLDDSPTKEEMSNWEFDNGFVYKNGSFFDQLRTNNLSYRLYNDYEDRFSDGIEAEIDGEMLGWMSIVGGLANISNPDDIHDLGDFPDDINSQYPYPYTWIEPNYGDVTFNTYDGGSSQHPTDTLIAGEKMIGNVYNLIRTSPYWATSIFIVTYDEHGGFYDHVAPPPAVEPGDPYVKGLNTNGFNFSQYGVRVPAVVISPRIPPGTIDHTQYDHTSILRTVEALFDVPSLTDRDAGANDVTALLSLDAPRAETILFGKISDWVESNPGTESLAAVPDPMLELDTTPLPERGNIHGFLKIAAKADFEMSDKSEASKAAVKAKILSITTRGGARAYIRSVGERLKAYKSASRAAAAG